MYVELYGPKSREKNKMPERVHLKVRHESASYFKDGKRKIKEFRQKLGTTSWQKFAFDRFIITDKAKCTAEKEKGNSKATIRAFSSRGTTSKVSFCI